MKLKCSNDSETWTGMKQVITITNNTKRQNQFAVVASYPFIICCLELAVICLDSLELLSKLIYFLEKEGGKFVVFVVQFLSYLE